MSAFLHSTSLVLAQILSWFSALSLATAIIFATYITSFCFTAPIPASFNKPETQPAASTRLSLYYACNAVVLLTGVYHALICLNYPPVPSLLCPNPSNLAPELFTWNASSILCMAAMLCSGQVLLKCFVQAGPSSNFEINVPKELVTTGIYSWAQHPAYVASFVIFLINGAFFQRIDGVAGCWLPESMGKSQAIEFGMRIGYAALGSFGLWALLRRVKTEESLLEKTFGSEWVDYNRRTKRFVPGLV